jgi:hypothetical protein
MLARFRKRPGTRTVDTVTLADHCLSGFLERADQKVDRGFRETSTTTFRRALVECALLYEPFGAHQKHPRPGLPRTVQPNSHAVRPNRHYTLTFEAP